MKRVLQHPLFSQAAVYIGGNFLTAAIPFLLLPILTRHLSPSDYGLVNLFNILQAVMTILIGLNTHGAISIRFYKMDKNELSLYIGNACIILAISFLLVILLALGGGALLAHWFQIPEVWWLLIATSAFFQFGTQILTDLYRLEGRPTAYVLMHGCRALLNVFFSVWFVVFLQMDWKGRGWAIVISNVIFGLIAFFLLKRGGYLRFKWHKPFIKDALRFGIPLVPHAISAWVITSNDRLFLNYFFDTNTVGLFSAGTQIAMILSMFTASFNSAWLPFLFKKLTEDNERAKVKIVQFSYAYFVLILMAAISLGLVAPPVMGHLLGERFSSASQFVFWMAIAYAFDGMYLMVGGYIAYANKTAILAMMTFIACLLHTLTNYVFLHWNGAVGVAQASAFTNALIFFLTWYGANRCIPMPWTFFKGKGIGDS